MRRISISLILILISCAAASGDWQWINPLPAGNDWYGISASQDGYIAVGGDAGLILEYTQTGFSIPDAPMMGRINRICVNGTFGIAVGEKSVVLLRDSNGWSLNQPQTTAWFYGATVSDSGEAWICGDLGKLFHFTGTEWEEQSTGTSTTLKDIDMKDGCGWVVGLYGTVRVWNGTGWQYISSGTSRFLRSVSGYDCDHAWVAGDLGVVLRWTGSSFSMESTPVSTNLYAVKAVDAEEAWAVGDMGVVLHRINGAWEQESIPDMPEINLRAVDFDSSTGLVWISGENGFICSYDGTTMTQLNHDILNQTDLAAIRVLPGNTSRIIMGTSGKCWRFSDDGFTEIPTGTSEDFHCLHFGTDGILRAGGDRGVFLEFINGQWESVDTGNTDDIRDIDMLSSGSIWTAGGHSDGSCVSWTVLHFDGNQWNAYSDSGS